MRFSRRSFLLGFFPVAAFPQFLGSCATSGGSALTVSARECSLSDEFFTALNHYRAASGKPALVRHAGLTSLAARHAAYLRERRGTFAIYGPNVSHFGFEGRALVARERYGIESSSENVASGSSGGVPMLMSSLKASKDHNYAMLSDWHSVGCAVVEDTDGRLFGVQIFGTAPQSGMLQRRLSGM